MIKICYKLPLLFLLTISCLISFSQINSTYTRFGLGEFENANHYSQISMGGIYAAYNNSITNNTGQVINFLQPASIANISFTGIDLGVQYRQFTMQDKQSTNTFNSAYITPQYFSICFPLYNKKNLGGLIAFRQVTQISYSALTTENLSLDTIRNNFSGSGGTYQLIIGVGKKFKRKLNLGLESGVYFGEKRADLLKSAYGQSIFYYTTSRNRSQLNFYGPFARIGTQYNVNLSKTVNKDKNTENTISMLIGGVYELKSQLKGLQTETIATVQLSTSQDYENLDTVIYSNRNGTVNFPSTLALGVSFNKIQSNRYGYFKVWSFALEYENIQWQNFSILGQTQPTANTQTFRLGGEISPIPNFNRQKVNLLTYRFGVNYGYDYLIINQSQLIKSEISLGISWPVRKIRNYDNQYTIINFAMTYGYRSATNAPLNESYININLGITLNDLWFIKRKYD